MPSVMSGLDESMSDIEARKKYPFELEKAMHNVMFIQHHMQRQDEFNAVSLHSTYYYYPSPFYQSIAQYIVDHHHPPQGLSSYRRIHIHGSSLCASLPSQPQEDQDWGFVAMVMDRLFLWLFSMASIIGTFVILCEAPSLYDDTEPIDKIYSIIAQKLYNLTVKHK